MTPHEDQRLIDRLNRGDVAAFEALYFRHRDWTVRLARRLTDCDEDALDVLQETFAYLHRKFPGFELRASLRTLLYRVVTNLAIRANQRRRRLGVDREIPERSAPEHREAAGNDPLDLDDDRRRLWAGVQRLTAGLREVVLLRYVQELSLEEIATALAIPVGTVKSRLHQAMAKLRDDSGLRRYFDPAE